MIDPLTVPPLDHEAMRLAAREIEDRLSRESIICRSSTDHGLIVLTNGRVFKRTMPDPEIGSVSAARHLIAWNGGRGITTNFRVIREVTREEILAAIGDARCDYAPGTGTWVEVMGD